MGTRHLYWILTSPSFAVQYRALHLLHHTHYICINYVLVHPTCASIVVLVEKAMTIFYQEATSTT
jgi:hypothetical protein